MDNTAEALPLSKEFADRLRGAQSLLLQLGFRLFSKKERPGLLLISKTLFDQTTFPDDFTFTCIDGEVISLERAKFLDDDTRFGLLAFGVMPPQYGKMYALIRAQKEGVVDGIPNQV